MIISQRGNSETIQLRSFRMIRVVMPVVSRTLTRLSKPETISQLPQTNANRGAGILPANLC